MNPDHTPKISSIWPTIRVKIAHQKVGVIIEFSSQLSPTAHGTLVLEFATARTTKGITVTHLNKTVTEQHGGRTAEQILQNTYRTQTVNKRPDRESVWTEKIRSEIANLEISGSWTECTGLLVISNQGLLSHCTWQHNNTLQFPVYCLYHGQLGIDYYGKTY